MMQKMNSSDLHFQIFFLSKNSDSNFKTFWQRPLNGVSHIIFFIFFFSEGSENFILNKMSMEKKDS